MQQLTAGKPAFGLGIYSFPLAAQIISQRKVERPVSPRALRYWLREGLTPATYGKGDSGSFVLSFYDLLSLEVVRKFREAGASLQLVRALEVVLRERYPALPRPFAHEIFFTDGASVWGQLNPENPRDLIELLGRRPGQVAWRGAIAKFAEEIDYREGLAVSWNVTPWVEIDPEVHFGAPVVRGTSVPITSVLKSLEVQDEEAVADAYGLTVEQVVGVKGFADAA